MAKRSRWSVGLISCAVLMVCLAWVGQANAAPQDFNQLLRGEYAFTGEAVCLASTLGFGVNAFGNFAPLNSSGGTAPPGPSSVFSFSIQGIRAFNGDGTGSVVARSVQVNHTNFGSNASDISSDFTYEVAPDRTFTVEHGPTTATAVPPAAGTSTTTGVKFSGRISQDLKTLVMSTEEPTVETRSFTPPVGPPGVDYRICHRARTAIKIK